VPIWRITHCATVAATGISLVEDIEADSYEREGSWQLLVIWQCVVNRPRMVVVRRLPMNVHVERRCA
jgi:hypothetical protein